MVLLLSLSNIFSHSAAVSLSSMMTPESSGTKGLLTCELVNSVSNKILKKHTQNIRITLKNTSNKINKTDNFLRQSVHKH